MATLTNHWAGAGDDVSLITLASATAEDYRLDPRVDRVAMGVMTDSGSAAEAVMRNLGRVRALRRQIQALHPDVVVTFNGPVNVLVLLACLRLNIPVIVSERIHPPAHDVGRVWALLRWLTYRFAAAVVVQSEATREWARSIVRPDRVHVIPNAVSPPLAGAQSDRARSRTVLGVGRLVTQKGFDVLVEAFGAVAHRHPDWCLTIIGRGPEESRLRALGASVDQHGGLNMPGVVVDPERHYGTAGLFVLPSRFEGFPNALLEAMASGCAVIAADCPVGPAEIVRDGVDGVLVPVGDAASLASALTRLMADEAERRRLGAAARQVVERFSQERVTRLWGEVITSVRR